MNARSSATECAAAAESLEAFCAQVRGGLHAATFEQQRALVGLLIDRVIVTDGDVEIRYIFPTTCHGPPMRFSHLRVDYLDLPPPPEAAQRSAILGLGAGASAPMVRDHLHSEVSQAAVQRVGVVGAIADQALG